MVATDTVVGIIGAIVLVGVMAGVFVYEYNQSEPPVDDGDTPPTFQETYPFLNATEDIDGDGTRNDNDTDLDGDGILNADDEAVNTTFAMTGSLGADPGPTSEFSLSLGFPVGTGNAHTVVTATWSVALGTGVPQPNLGARLVLPDGELRPVGVQVSGQTATATLELEPVGVGDAAFEVFTQDGSLLPADGIRLMAEVHYG